MSQRLSPADSYRERKDMEPKPRQDLTGFPLSLTHSFTNVEENTSLLKHTHWYTSLSHWLRLWKKAGSCWVVITGSMTNTHCYFGCCQAHAPHSPGRALETPRFKLTTVCKVKTPKAVQHCSRNISETWSDHHWLRSKSCSNTYIRVQLFMSGTIELKLSGP